MRRILFIAAFLIASTGFAQEVRAKLERSNIKIGEQVKLSFELPFENKDFNQLVWPRLKDTLIGKVEIVDSSIQKNGKIITAKDYLITCFDSGTYVLPALAFVLNADSFFTAPVELIVSSVAVDTTKAIKDIKTIKEVKAKNGEEEGFLAWLKKYWYIVALLIIAIGVGLYFLLRKKKKIEPEIVVPPLPLHEQLIKDLEDLDAKQIWTNNPKLYYSELTDMLRAYIEKRYGIDAMEQTTLQLSNSLKTSGMNAEAYEIIKSTLELADMVKFAKAIPTPYENQSVMLSAKRFAELTQVIQTTNE
jgi:hypothetical protein